MSKASACSQGWPTGKKKNPCSPRTGSFLIGVNSQIIWWVVANATRKDNAFSKLTDSIRQFFTPSTFVNLLSGHMTFIFGRRPFWVVSQASGYRELQSQKVKQRVQHFPAAFTAGALLHLCLPLQWCSKTASIYYSIPVICSLQPEVKSVILLLESELALCLASTSRKYSEIF